MTTVERVIETTPQRVWDVLADGWLYPLWVVGATRMREVDQDWPSIGSRIHHSVGVWPAVLDDNTEITACEPLKRLELRAKAWPFLGEADVVLDLSVHGAGTRVVMSEDAASGPGQAGAQADSGARDRVAQHREPAAPGVPRRTPTVNQS